MEIIVAAWGIYLARTRREETVDLGWLVEDERAAQGGALFAACVPLRLSHDLDGCFEQVLDAARSELHEVARRLTFAQDLIPRTPGLHQSPTLQRGYRPFIAVQHGRQRPPTQEMPAAVILLVPEPGEQGKVTFHSEIIPESEMKRILRQFTTLLHGLVTEGNQAVGRINLVPQEDRAGLLAMYTGPRREFDRRVPVHRLFENRAALAPQAIALEFQGKQLTYDELNARANRLAHRLLREGSAPNSLVGLFLKRSVEMIVALLAILKSGGAYLPLDPAYPPERTAMMLRDAKPGLLLTTRSMAGTIPEVDVGTLVLEIDETENGEGCTDNPERCAAPSDLAYVIYTSGTAGRPKGVMIEHHALTNYTLAATEKFNLSGHDRVLQFASLSFDACAEEIYPCLVRGATLVLRTEDVIASPARFLRSCEELCITVLDLPTAFWRHLVDYLARENMKMPAPIRLIIIGGEAAPAEAWKKWRTLRTEVALLNTYGPTEATIVSTWYDSSVDERLGFVPATLPIGRPVPNTSAYVLDAHLQLLPLGGIGELFLGGENLARGYLHLPEASASKFIANPIHDAEEPILYRTGDKACYRSDGNLEFLGRFDHQVKIRGFRVELGEIESTLEKHPAIKAASVVAKSWDVSLILSAFVVKREGEPLDPDLVRGWLRERLPDYMIPAHVTVLPELPNLPNGKTDRQALEDWPENVVGTTREVSLPRTEMERAVLNIWQEILPPNQMGIHDNFFDLGGHSLAAVAVNARVYELIGIEMPLQWLFTDPTVEGMARWAELAQAPDRKKLAPRSLEESNLSKLCEDILQSVPLTAYEDFSALIAQKDKSEKLTREIFLRYGIKISVRALKEKATIAQLMETIRSAQSRTGLNRWKSLFQRRPSEQVVALRREGSGTPLFICPGGWTRENELVIFAAMLAHFPEDRPVYGLKQDFALRSSRVASSVKAVAKNFLREILKIQPAGPCDLVVECISAVVGLEVARQLSKMGQPRGHLILLDPTRLIPERVRNDPLYQKLPRKVRKYYEVLAEGPMPPYAGHLHVISPDDEKAERARISAWALSTDENTSVIRVPGNHATYLREHCANVGREIAKILTRSPQE